MKPPSQIEQSHSERLLQLIIDEIGSSGGWIPFERFMQLALYAPALGYYAAGSQKFGSRGDFVTAPMLGKQFAYCLARQIAQVHEQMKSSATVLEFGAGNAQLASDILLHLDSFDALPERYIILETSAELIQRQREWLDGQLPELNHRIEWHDKLPESKINGVILANEVLDAMPAIRFAIGSDGLAYEIGVTTGPEGLQLHLASQPMDDNFQGWIATYKLPTGYQSEIGRQAAAWTTSVGEKLESGAMLLVDYGFPGPEYYHHDRNRGTLMCHYRHNAHDDPLYFPGLQDITCHVNFTAVAQAGRAAGLEVAGFCDQGNFLLSLGLLDNLAAVQNQNDDPRVSIELAQEIKKLTLPHEMGELFKVLALSKNIADPLQGFTMRNDCHKVASG